jgi:hypothetical protein
MTFGEKTSIALIRLFVRPSRRNDSISFRTEIRKAKRVLVCCPKDENLLSKRSPIADLVRLFPRDDVVLLGPEFPVDRSRNATGGIIDHPPVAFPDLGKPNYWTMRRSQSLSAFSKNSFDLLIDLDPDPNLLHFYLCRIINSSIRIGLEKPYGNVFYNFQYNTRSSSSRETLLKNLIRFLQNVRS